MADITGNTALIEHITTADEAAHIMYKHNVKTYKQHNHQGKTLAAYEADEDVFVHDVTEREKTREEIEEQQKVLKHLQMAAARAAKKESQDEE